MKWLRFGFDLFLLLGLIVACCVVLPFAAIAVLIWPRHFPLVSKPYPVWRKP
jgi:uncharacterized iron-regulated membrane protein